MKVLKPLFKLLHLRSEAASEQLLAPPPDRLFRATRRLSSQVNLPQAIKFKDKFAANLVT